MKKKVYLLLLVVSGMQIMQAANAQCTIAIDATATCTKDTLSATVSSPVYELQWKHNGKVVHTSSAAENKYGEVVAGGNGQGRNLDQLDTPFKIFVDTDGSVYVADYYHSRIVKWAAGATSGTYVASGHATCVFLDNAGNIYYPSSSSEVSKLAPGTTLGVVVAGSSTAGSGDDQLNDIRDIFVDNNGNIYIADYGNGRVQKWAPGATSGVTVATDKGRGIYVDKDDNVYVADGGIQKWAPGATTGITIAGEQQDIISSTDVCMDTDGNFYVSEDYTNSIKKYTIGDAKALTIAGGNRIDALTPATNTLISPQGLFLDNKGYVYAPDQDKDRVLKFSVAPNNIYQYIPEQAGQYTATGKFTSGCDAVSSAVSIKASPNLQISGNTTFCTGDSTILTATGADAYNWSPAAGLNITNGSTVIASPAADRIYTITGSNANGCSAIVQTGLKVNQLPAIAIEGNACSDTIEATVTNAAASVQWKLNDTTIQTSNAAWNTNGTDIGNFSIYAGRSVFVDRNNNIYVSMGFEDEGNEVLKFTPGNPDPEVIAGSYDHYGNSANLLEFPNDVWVDLQGNVFIADRNNGRIQKWAPGATEGITVATGSSPTGVAVDGFGNIYVVENTAHDVMKWVPGATEGILVAGKNGISGSTADKLSGPIDVYVDGKGNLYIVDAANNRVQKWAPGATEGITVAGGNGKGAAANQLNNPSDVYADEEENVYVCDYDNHRIQRWAPGASSGTTILNTGAANGISFDKEGNLYTVFYGGSLFKHEPVTNFKYTPGTAGTYTVTATSIDGCSTTEQVPGCNVCEPPYNLTVSGITRHSAHFEGMVSVAAQLNQLRIRKMGTAQWKLYSGPQMEATLNNLDANTRYEWQARSKCISGTSQWVAGPAFKTRRIIPLPSYITKADLQPAKAGISILPNPNQGNFRILINVNNKMSKTSIQLYDAKGKQVYHQDAGTINNNITQSINLQGRIAAGVYLLVVQTGNVRYTEKVVIIQ